MWGLYIAYLFTLLLLFFQAASHHRLWCRQLITIGCSIGSWPPQVMVQVAGHHRLWNRQSNTTGCGTGLVVTTNCSTGNWSAQVMVQAVVQAASHHKLCPNLVITKASCCNVFNFKHAGPHSITYMDVSLSTSHLVGPIDRQHLWIVVERWWIHYNNSNYNNNICSSYALVSCLCNVV